MPWQTDANLGLGFVPRPRVSVARPHASGSGPSLRSRPNNGVVGERWSGKGILHDIGLHRMDQDKILVRIGTKLLLFINILYRIASDGAHIGSHRYRFASASIPTTSDRIVSDVFQIISYRIVSANPGPCKSGSGSQGPQIVFS